MRSCAPNDQNMIELQHWILTICDLAVLLLEVQSDYVDEGAGILDTEVEVADSDDSFGIPGCNFCSSIGKIKKALDILYHQLEDSQQGEKILERFTDNSRKSFSTEK